MSAPRNPIYQAMVRTRLIQKMARDFQDEPTAAAAKARFNQRWKALEDLERGGFICLAEKYDLTQRIARPYHAALLKAARRMPLMHRRRLTREIVKFHSEGLRF